MSTAIMFVGGDAPTLEEVTPLCASNAWELVAVTNKDEAAAALEARTLRLVVANIKQAGNDELELTRHLTQNHPEVPVVVLTENGNEDLAVACFRAGAADYVRRGELSRELVPSIKRLIKEEDECSATEKRGPSIKGAESKTSRKATVRADQRLATLANEYIIAHWHDATSSVAAEQVLKKDYSPEKLRVLRRQVERLDKWASLNPVGKHLRRHERHEFADVVFLIPMDESGDARVSLRLPTFCRNLSPGGCSLLHNRLLPPGEWAIFFPHLQPFSMEHACLKVQVVRDRVVSMGMYEIGISFTGIVTLSSDEIAGMSRT